MDTRHCVQNYSVGYVCFDVEIFCACVLLINFDTIFRVLETLTTEVDSKTRVGEQHDDGSRTTTTLSIYIYLYFQQKFILIIKK